MYKFLFFLTYFILFFLIDFSVWAQKPDTLKNPVKPKISYAPSAVRVGFDLVPPIISNVDNRFINYEALGEVQLGDRYILGFEVGYTNTKRGDSQYDYQNKGLYFRLGADYNFWRVKKSKISGLASLGFRYGFTNFQQNINYSLSNPYWGTSNGEFNNENLNAHFIELVGRLHAVAFKNLYFGPILRVKARLSASKIPGFEVHDIPGFGINNFLRLQPGYLIQFQIPLKKNK
jgi:hypothetical protein